MAEPTGKCWCGCGSPRNAGFFFSGDDSKALHAAMEILYGRRDRTARFLEAHEFHPGGQRSKELRDMLDEREQRKK